MDLLWSLARLVCRLGENKIGDKGAMRIGEALENNSSLKELRYVTYCLEVLSLELSLFALQP